MTYTAKTPKELRARRGTQAEILSTEFGLIDTELDAHAVLIAAAAGGAGSALASTKFIVGDGDGVAASVNMYGDATLANTGVVTIAAGVVTEAKQAPMTSEGLHSARIARTVYDFSVDGGTIGSISLGATLPDKARVVKFWYEVITTLTSSTDAATVAISIPTDDVAGLVAATAISAEGNIWDTGLHSGIQDGAVANISEKCTAARALTMTIAVENVTAGKIVFFAEYVVSA
jgi:hypothetical protein